MNWPAFMLAIMFFVEENRYFGWNGLPKSDAELIADGIFLLIVAISISRPRQ